MIDSLEKFWKITIYVPLKEDPAEMSLDGIVGKMRERIDAIIKAVGTIGGVGRIGHYEDVYELAVGYESYRPTKGALPRYGTIGNKMMLGKVAIVTYLARNSNPRSLEQVVEAARAAHPWEHPIIEFTDCLLYVPPEPGRSETDHDSAR
jgi:hypothetical protein